VGIITEFLVNFFCFVFYLNFYFMKFIVNRSQNTEFAQPMIDKKMREVRNVTSHDTIQGLVSIAEDLSKLFKTKRARG
jgi:hypothetical protein